MSFFNTVKERAKLIRQRASQFEQNRRVQRVNKKRIALADLENKRSQMKEEYELDKARERQQSQINQMQQSRTPSGLGGIFSNFGNNVRSNLARNIQKSKQETANNIFTQGSKTSIYTMQSKNNPYNFGKKKR